MTKRKIAACLMLPVVAACWSDAPPSVTPPLERTDPSTRVQDVVEAEPVAFGLDLGFMRRLIRGTRGASIAILEWGSSG